MTCRQFANLRYIVTNDMPEKLLQIIPYMSDADFEMAIVLVCDNGHIGILRTPRSKHQYSDREIIHAARYTIFQRRCAALEFLLTQYNFLAGHRDLIATAISDDHTNLNIIELLVIYGARIETMTQQYADLNLTYNVICLLVINGPEPTKITNYAGAHMIWPNLVNDFHRTTFDTKYQVKTIRERRKQDMLDQLMLHDTTIYLAQLPIDIIYWYVLPMLGAPRMELDLNFATGITIVDYGKK